MPSDCLSVETLAAAMTGGVTAQELERVRTHLRECAHCRAVVELALDLDGRQNGEEEPT